MLGMHEESSVVQLHFPVLQQVVENGQDVSLHFLDAFQDEDAPLRGRSHSALKRKQSITDFDAVD